VAEGDQQAKAAMRKHEWAVLMLWDGVTGPSDYAWGRGSDALAETRIFGDAESRGQTNDVLLASEAELRRLGSAAKTLASLPERANLYGLMLATCGDCHQALDVELPVQGMSPPGP